MGVLAFRETGGSFGINVADLVLWDGYPLSSFGLPDKVLIDGDVYFDRSLPGFGMPHYREGE